eukprot:TRINITY_DN65917_c0_g1_i1.p1 TRINITY_DN65917_c0_g1~~TRINITY_DN65917_c0_g1_i1.p1  ORF type:complete len:482 (-),score=71.17 TRINITY_DN65917_c0_g1_i1:327-1772(-)
MRKAAAIMARHPGCFPVICISSDDATIRKRPLTVSRSRTAADAWPRGDKYGATPLHFAVWHGDEKETRFLLDVVKVSPDVTDRDGQTPWDWAEARNSESMMEILSEYGGGPLPIWSVRIDPCSDGEVRLSCTNFAGEDTCCLDFPENARVADLFERVTQDTGRKAVLTLANNRVLGLADGQLAMLDLLDSSPSAEKRLDPHDGLSYTKLEFFKYYGSQQGAILWSEAAPDETAAATAESLMELANAENAMISEAVFRSRFEPDRDGEKVTAGLGFPDAADASNPLRLPTVPLFSCCNEDSTQILVKGFNKHPLEFTKAIEESALAQSLVKRGVDITPEWANGAKILVEGLTSSLMGEGGFDPRNLRCWHVVMLPENDEDVKQILFGLNYRKRPRVKTMDTILLKHLPGEDCMDDEVTSISQEQFTEGAVEEELGTSFAEYYCTKNTFIDVPKNLRVGWSPRSMFTKSSNDRHGIANPREWN